LQTSKTAVQRNQQLVQLNSEVAHDFSLEKMASQPADAAALRPLYTRWGFKSLLRELEPALIQPRTFFQKRPAPVKTMRAVTITLKRHMQTPRINKDKLDKGGTL